MSKICYIGSGLAALSLCGFATPSSAAATNTSVGQSLDDSYYASTLTEKDRNRIKAEIASELIALNHAPPKPVIAMAPASVAPAPIPARIVTATEIAPVPLASSAPVAPAPAPQLVAKPVVAAPAAPAVVVTNSAAPAPAAPVPASTAAAAPSSPAPAQASPGFFSKLKVEVGVDTSTYKYREKATTDPFVNLSGYPVGFDLAVTAPLPWQDWYFRSEGRASIGHVDYSSASGIKHNERNDYGEIRGLVGKNFFYRNDTVFPYAGAAYRYLYNDARGVTNLGINGYRRVSQYNYVPVGVTDTYRFTNLTALSANFEYDIFTGGSEKSYLQDSNAAVGDVMNHQHHGKGARGDVLFHVGTWSVGPWFSYWHIHASDVVPIPGISPPVGAQEPYNKTTEFGVMLMKQVW